MISSPSNPPLAPSDLRHALFGLNAQLVATRTRFAKNPKAAAQLGKWIDESRAFLALEPSGWMQPPVSAQLFKVRKPVAEGNVAIAKELAV